jgi:hypothetical protein
MINKAHEKYVYLSAYADPVHFIFTISAVGFDSDTDEKWKSFL